MTGMKALPALLAFGAAFAWAHPAPLDMGRYKLQPASCGVRHTLWIEHYAAELLVPEGQTVAVVTDSRQPKALRMRVLNTTLMPPEIPDKWREALAPVVDPPALAQLRAVYQSLRTGDLVLVTYEPDQGVTVRVNGRAVLSAAGHRAIDALVDAWAHDMPAGKKLARTAAENRCV